MKRLIVSVVVGLVAAGLVVAGCGQAAPAPAPTKAPVAEPTKAPAVEATKVVEPTKAVAQPTAVPVKKVDFPQKGRPVTFIVPWAAGGAADMGARLLAEGLEKALEVPVQVVNMGGASGQIGLTELVKSRPDGYTIGLTNFSSTLTLYLDASRQAIFNRQSFAPIALQVSDPSVIFLRPDSPYKTLKDFVDAAKAKPDTVSVGTGGIWTADHFALLLLQSATGAKFNIVNFNSGAEALTAMLGGHVDAFANLVSAAVAPNKAGQVRVLAVLDKEPNKFLPGVPTAESQGYKVYFRATRGICAPGGTPAEVVEILSSAAKKAMESEDMKKKMEDAGQGLLFMDAKQYAAHWDEMESQIKPLMALAK